jgi:hypothetical protein
MEVLEVPIPSAFGASMLHSGHAISESMQGRRD